MRSATVLMILLAFGTSLSGCGRKKMSDRDTKREQARINAEIKRQELSPATGLFRGTFNQDEEPGQEVTLRLEIKDVPDTETGEIDPVLVPVLSGSLRLTFGETEGGEYFSWAVQRADYDASQKRVDLVMVNETLKELNLSVHQDGEQLNGTWTAPTLSSTGNASLTRVDPLNLQSSTPEIRGVYPGALVWKDDKIFQAVEINVTSEQDRPDGFTLTASAKLYSGYNTSAESLIISLDLIDFNPLTRRIVLAGSASDVSFIGSLTDGALKGSASSKLYGRLGAFEVAKDKTIAAPAGHAALKPLAGGYFGDFVAKRDDVRLPPRMLVNLVTYHEPEQPSSMGVSGNLRLYFGDFSSTEFVELPFRHIEYSTFTRALVLQTGGDTSLTLKGSVRQGRMELKVFDDTLGYVGDFTGQPRRPTDNSASVTGEYAGISTWEALAAYQKVSVTLSSTPTNNGFKLTGVGRLNFGADIGGEQLVYNLDRVTFDPLTGILDLRPTDNDELVFKGNLTNGKLVGEWRTAQLGRMGTLNLARDTTVTPPPDLMLLGSLKGSYRGTIVSTSDQVNLPERLMIGLVTRPDQDNPRGLLLSGNSRLYLGPFDSQDYVEYAFETVQFDFFLRRLTAKLAGDLPLTFKGDVGNERISGEIFHDSLGLVGTFEVEK